MAVRTRMSADERRREILEAARYEFADHGLHGTSTEDIARRAGISQPYVFRLFGTKKELFLLAAASCLQETLEAMRHAAVGKTGEEALQAMGQAYMNLLNEDPRRLRLQMEMYAAADDPEVRDVAREGYGALVDFVERASGAPTEAVTQFFAYGMLLNVLASMGLDRHSEGWASRLLAGCPGNPDNELRLLE
jgi:AcrR family transcriptional regulator